VPLPQVVHCWLDASVQVRPALQAAMPVQAVQTRFVALVHAVLSKVPAPQAAVHAAQVSAGPSTR
jgi:hypothetical protein